MKKPKIAILTTFSNFNPEYSLASVVQQQLKALVKHGYNPVLVVLEIFKDEDKVAEGVEVRKALPQLKLEPYTSQNADNLEDDVKKVRPKLREALKDVDVVLAHDIIFINSFLPYNVAMRREVDDSLSHVKWLHWMHSGPSYRDLSDTAWDNLATLPPNSKVVYMNHTDVVRAAEHFHTTPDNVRTIYNPMDIRELYDFHPLSRKIIDDYGVMDADYIATYPLSSTRMGRSGKQLSKAVWIMAELKKRGKTVKLIVPNAHANADKEKKSIQEMYQFAFDKGLARQDLIFTSLIDAPKWEHGAPHKVVMDFFTLGNLFLFPSVSENCPLVLLEAMASKNLLVLNESFDAFREFGQENALYFGFGSLLERDRDFPHGEEKYYQDIALLIESRFNQNIALKAQRRLRKKFSLDAVFKEQLEPAIMELYGKK